MIPKYPRVCWDAKKIGKIIFCGGIFTLPMTLNFGFLVLKVFFQPIFMCDEFSKWPQKKLNSHKRGQGYISLQGYFWLFGYFWLILRGMVGMVRYQISKIQPKILSWLPKSSISSKNQVDSSKDARELSKITLEGNISLFSFKNPCSTKEVPNWQLL